MKRVKVVITKYKFNFPIFLTIRIFLFSKKAIFKKVP